jgi:hypothetical protein
MMIEQYLLIEKSSNFLPACIYETPVWRYLLYKTAQEVFDEVTYDPAVPSQPFTVKNVIIDGVEYTPRPDLAGTRANARSWTQDGELLYVHYAGGFPAWLFSSHVYGMIIGRSTGKTRFFDGMKYGAGLDIKLQYKIEADNLEYGKMKFTGGTYTVPARGEFDGLTDILGNDIETAYSLDGVTKTPLNAMFIEEVEITLGEVSLKAADRRERLNVPVAAEVFTEAEYPKMKETDYGKNKQEAFGFCRGVPAVCLDQRDIYQADQTNYNDYRTFRAASVITSVTKIEVKMTQPESGQNKGGDVWVDQTGSQTLTENGTFTLPANRCLPLLSNGEPDYGNEPYEVRVTGTFRTNGTHWAILQELLAAALGDTWASQCDTGEMQAELSGTGTVGLFIEKETKIFEIIETLQSSGVYGWQLHDWRGLLTIRKDDNARLPLTAKTIKGIDIRNIDEVGVSLGMDGYATTVQVEYRRNYSEKEENAKNVLQDASNRAVLFPLYRIDKTYTALSYLDTDADTRARADYLLAHFAIPRPMIRGMVLTGERWLDLRLYDIIGVYLEQELRREQVPVMLMVLSNEIRRQEASLFAAAQKVYYVLDRRRAEKRRFAGNIYIKIMRIEHDIAGLTTTIDGLYIGNIKETENG